jgi:hypothetical protein
MIDHQIDEEMILIDEVSDDALEAAAFVSLGGFPTLLYGTYCFACPATRFKATQSLLSFDPAGDRPQSIQAIGKLRLSSPKAPQAIISTVVITLPNSRRHKRRMLTNIPLEPKNSGGMFGSVLCSLDLINVAFLCEQLLN